VKRPKPQTSIDPRRLTLRWFNQANELHTNGDLAGALTLYKRILKLESTNMVVLLRVGTLLWQLGENESALRLLLQMVARAPQWVASQPTEDQRRAAHAAHGDAQHNVGVVYEAMGKTMQALAAYEDALLLNPQRGDSWEGIGKCLHAMGSAEDAVRCFERCLVLSPPTGTQTAERRYNMSYPLLSLGRWTEGWEAYEARFQSPIFLGNYVMRHHEPVWDGSALEGRRLLVHAEQGFGDSIMMARYLPRIDGDVHIEVQRPLVRLFEQSFSGRTVTAQGEPYPRCDVQLAMMSLAHRFGMDGTNVPTDPWFVPPAEPTLPEGERMKIGFVWAGSPDHRSDKRRSIGLEHWKPLWDVPGVTWYSLQVDQEPVSVRCHNCKPLITDFADTAALIAQLDLMISCDTAVAHLAGALGKPVWLLLPTIPDYRWGMHEPTSVWYPTMRLVRQPTQGDWPSVFAEVKAALEALIATQVPA
jgi:tetratricopeptide (TPR) repeat protein